MKYVLAIIFELILRELQLSLVARAHRIASSLFIEHDDGWELSIRDNNNNKKTHARSKAIQQKPILLLVSEPDEEASSYTLYE